MIDLANPLAWEQADAEALAVLSDLQGNILKGHGRRATRHLFLKFGDDQAAARAFIRKIEPLLPSALAQLQQARAFKAGGPSGGPFVAFMLTAAGYAALGVANRAPQPADGGAFQQGMRARAASLADPAGAALDPGYRGDIHAMVLIAGDPDNDASWTSNAADEMETRILNLMSNSASVVASEAGRAIFDVNGHGLEHFGYVDGRSQPLLLREDIDNERDAMGGIDVWDPAFPLSQVLVQDPGGGSASAFGSFFVFRKLEQNVKGFKTAEDALGDLTCSGELAGARIVGRFENGTPVEMDETGALMNPISNNFNYSADPTGRKCPLHGHIRKSNPRGESAAKFGIPLASERSHIMARRGITYGRRASIVDPQDQPEGGVGLLFMAYQQNLNNQFEFTQASWVNNENFVAAGVGRDPIIGQGGVSALRHFSECAGHVGEIVVSPFGGFVTFKGGEYFFAPAKSTLATL